MVNYKPMNILINKYGNKGAQDIMQFISFLLFATIIVLLIMNNILLKKSNTFLSELTQGDAVISIVE